MKCKIERQNSAQEGYIPFKNKDIFFNKWWADGFTICNTLDIYIYINKIMEIRTKREGAHKAKPSQTIKAK